MAKSEQPGISPETQEMIEGQVKKGKARKFFMIYKGASIKTIVVFKKGAFGPKIMQAKKDGFKGEVCYGVVTGSGKNLFFWLPGNGEIAAAMKVDSWEEKPPTKKAKLREFLNDNGLSFKPSFHIITDPAQSPDPDAASDAPIAPPPPGSEASEDEESATGAPASAEQESTAVPVSPTPTTAADTKVLQLKLAEGLKKLKPAMEKAIQLAPDRRGELAGTMAQIVGEIKGQLFEDARTNMVAFGKVIQAINSAPDTGSDTPAQELATEWKSQHAALEPQYLEALQMQPANASQLRTVMTFATEKAAAGEYAKAVGALQRLGPMIAEATAVGAGRETDVIPEGKVQELRDWFSRARTRWEIAVRDSRNEIAKVVDSIQQQDPELAVSLDDLAHYYDQQLADLLQDQEGMDAEQASPQLQQVLSRVDEIRGEIEADEVVDYLDVYPEANVKLRETLLKSLDDIKQYLQV